MDEESLQAMCNSLALQARHLAFDEEYMSPFAKRAQSFGINTSGGKPDDITVLLAVVTAEDEHSQTASRQSMTKKEEKDKSPTADEEFVAEMELPSREIVGGKN